MNKQKTFQSFNKRIKAWVKYKKETNGKYKILNTKQNKPRVPFTGVPVKTKKR